MNLVFSTADFSLLPAHIITQTLGYLRINDLKNATLVCKSWYYASTDPQIERTLAVRPTDENIRKICDLNRSYGIMKFYKLKFDNELTNIYYFKFFEKFGPFVYELHIEKTEIKIYFLLKLLELSTHLKVISFNVCNHLEDVPSFFPLDYDCEEKKRIVKNLSGLRKMSVEYFRNIQLIADLLRYTKNLHSFGYDYAYLGFKYSGAGRDAYQEFFKIFDNDNISNLRNLNLNLHFSSSAVDFITNFIKIKNFHLQSFTLNIEWKWIDGIMDTSLYHKFICKLQNLKEFSIYRLPQNQLTFICDNMMSLKHLDCLLLPGNDPSFAYFGKLKQLEKLRFGVIRNFYYQFTYTDLVEIDKFFECKFEYLQSFKFDEPITEKNLVQFCKSHPNLIELNLGRLLTENLGIIFKHLIKLRILKIQLATVEGTQNSSLFNKRWSKYKISRLQDLEELYLRELVNGINKDDVSQLKKLRSSNLKELFDKQKSVRFTN